MADTFLTAEWRKLVIANYTVDRHILSPYLPFKTELDLWQGACYLSLVGFMFVQTRVKGFKIPFHTDFEEVNLRFYVRYNDKGEWKRGVVFIKEIVPKPALTLVANLVYKEKYETMPMDHAWNVKDGALGVEYRWKKKRWHSISVNADFKAGDMKTGSPEEFITEHYWGYTKINDRMTAEYAVEHPRWQVYHIRDYKIDVDFKAVYGETFGFLNSQKPASVFLAEGSEIKVKDGKAI